MPLNKSKIALDGIIRKSRVHLYKPIQVAEILHHHRTEKGWDLLDLESYRNMSKRWRDEISLHLVGRRSTSSQKYQDNLFEENAVPPLLLDKLGSINKKSKGLIEAYIYKSLETRLSLVREVEKYIHTSSADDFSIITLVGLFESAPGLRRSIDKMYEIAVYALFSTIVRSLQAEVTLEIKNKDEQVLSDFDNFIKMVLGIDKNNVKQVSLAALYRVGVANASDRGLDMWTNFGPALQVKHLTLTQELAEDITDGIAADRIVIICLDAEKEMIQSILKQVGIGEKIQGIITLKDLEIWYKLCLSNKYRDTLGLNLLKDVEREFDNEFPSSKEIVPFMSSRSYDKLIFPPEWQVHA